jgi:hypothetical protein
MRELGLEATAIRNLCAGFVARRALQPHPQVVLNDEELCAVALTPILAFNRAAAAIGDDAFGHRDEP